MINEGSRERCNFQYGFLTNHSIGLLSSAVFPCTAAIDSRNVVIPFIFPPRVSLQKVARMYMILTFKIHQQSALRSVHFTELRSDASLGPGRGSGPADGDGNAFVIEYVCHASVQDRMLNRGVGSWILESLGTSNTITSLP